MSKNLLGYHYIISFINYHTIILKCLMINYKIETQQSIKNMATIIDCPR